MNRTARHPSKRMRERREAGSDRAWFQTAACWRSSKTKVSRPSGLCQKNAFSFVLNVRRKFFTSAVSAIICGESNAGGVGQAEFACRSRAERLPVGCTHISGIRSNPQPGPTGTVPVHTTSELSALARSMTRAATLSDRVPDPLHCHSDTAIRHKGESAPLLRPRAFSACSLRLGKNRQAPRPQQPATRRMFRKDKRGCLGR